MSEQNKEKVGEFKFTGRGQDKIKHYYSCRCMALYGKSNDGKLCDTCNSIVGFSHPHSEWTGIEDGHARELRMARINELLARISEEDINILKSASAEIYMIRMSDMTDVEKMKAINYTFRWSTSSIKCTNVQTINHINRLNTIIFNSLYTDEYGQYVLTPFTEATYREWWFDIKEYMSNRFNQELTDASVEQFILSVKHMPECTPEIRDIIPIIEKVAKIRKEYKANRNKYLKGTEE